MTKVSNVFFLFFKTSIYAVSRWYIEVLMHRNLGFLVQSANVVDISLVSGLVLLVFIKNSYSVCCNLNFLFLLFFKKILTNKEKLQNFTFFSITPRKSQKCWKIIRKIKNLELWQNTIRLWYNILISCSNYKCNRWEALTWELT